MKFLTLDLLAYGHFHQKSLSFPADGPNLHIIHGPNEAGKSTMLRAITGFLYGIERATSDAHRFEGNDLRIGAKVWHSSGRERYFIRRKSTGSLRAEDDTALDEAQLSALLSVQERKHFEAMFGLSHEQLRKAGEALASSKNAAAEAIFSAVLEGASLRATLGRLQDEAEGLLSATGRAGDLAKAAKQYRELREGAKKSEGSLSRWKQLQEEYASAEEKIRALETEVRALRSERRRLERVHRTLLWLRRRAEAIEARGALGAVRLLEPDIAQRRRDLVHERDEARVAVDALTTKLDRARRDREALAVPEALVAFAPRVQALSEDLGTYRKARTDRSGLVHEVLPLRRRAEELLRELGHPTLPLEEIETLRVPAPEQDRIRALQKRGVELSTRRTQIRAQLAEVEAERATRAAALVELDMPGDVAVLRATWERSHGEHDLDRVLQDAAAEHEALSRTVREEATALGLTTHETAALAGLRIPTAEAIWAADAAATASQSEHGVLTEQRRRAAEALTVAQRTCEEFEKERLVPSEVGLREARARRDRAWEEVRRAWSSGVLLAAEPDTTGAGGLLAELFSLTMRDADAVADALRSESERVAHYAQIQRARDEAEAELNTSDQALASWTRREAERLEAWQALWAEAGITPSSPRRMVTWPAQWDQLVRKAQQRDAADAKHAHLAERAEELRRALIVGLGLAGVLCPEDTPWPALRALVEQTLAQAVAAFQQQVFTRSAIERLDLSAQRLRGQLDDVEAQHDEWQAQWGEATARLRSGFPLDLDGMDAILERLTSLFEVAEQRNRLEKRIKAIEKDIARFERELEERLGQMELALEGPAIDRAETLLESVSSAVAAAQRRAGLDEQIAAVEQELDAARARYGRALAGIERTFAETGCESVEALEAAEALSDRARALDAAQAEAESHLRDLGEGWSLSDLESAAAGTDSDQILAALEAMKDEVRRKEETLAEAQRSLGELRERQRQYTAGDTAAAQFQEAQSQADHARALAARCARLHIGSLMLQRAMVRYQEQSQGAILARAEELFKKLTRGRYDRLRVEYEGDGASIRCMRGDQAVQVKDRVMSDGTLDQLYLALRLASIEQHLSMQEPMPLVLDDIFIHFDDDRAQAGIEVLAEFSQKTQVLLLTHHARNIELARRALPDAAWRELHL